MWRLLWVTVSRVVLGEAQHMMKNSPSYPSSLTTRGLTTCSLRTGRYSALGAPIQV